MKKIRGKQIEEQTISQSNLFLSDPTELYHSVNLNYFNNNSQNKLQAGSNINIVSGVSFDTISLSDQPEVNSLYIQGSSGIISTLNTSSFIKFNQSVSGVREAQTGATLISNTDSVYISSSKDLALISYGNLDLISYFGEIYLNSTNLKFGGTTGIVESGLTFKYSGSKTFTNPLEIVNKEYVDNSLSNSGITVNNYGNNRIITATNDPYTVQAQSNLTYDGSTLNVGGIVTNTIVSEDNSNNLILFNFSIVSSFPPYNITGGTSFNNESGIYFFSPVLEMYVDSINIGATNDLYLQGSSINITNFTNCIVSSSGNFKYSGSKTFIDPLEIVNKEYVDNSLSNSGLTINNYANNRIITATNDPYLAQAQSNLTFDGNNLNVIGNTTILGNLTVSGTTFNNYYENVFIKDNLLLLNSGETGNGVTKLISGIEIDRGTATNYQFIFDESSDTFRIGEIGSLQAVATREDSPITSGLVYWNNTAQRFDTSSIITSNYTIGLNSTQSFINFNTDTIGSVLLTSTNNNVIESTLASIYLRSNNGNINLKSNNVIISGSTILKYESLPSITNDLQITNKKYVDDKIINSFVESGITINNYGDNRLTTSTNNSKVLQSHTGLTFNGDTLEITSNLIVNNRIYNDYIISKTNSNFLRLNIGSSSLPTLRGSFTGATWLSTENLMFISSSLDTQISATRYLDIRSSNDLLIESINNIDLKSSSINIITGGTFKYSDSKTFTDPLEVVNKEYVDDKFLGTDSISVTTNNTGFITVGNILEHRSCIIDYIVSYGSSYQEGEIRILYNGTTTIGNRSFQGDNIKIFDNNLTDVNSNNIRIRLDNKESGTVTIKYLIGRRISI